MPKLLTSERGIFVVSSNRQRKRGQPSSSASRCDAPHLSNLNCQWQARYKMPSRSSADSSTSHAQVLNIARSFCG